MKSKCRQKACKKTKNRLLKYGITTVVTAGISVLIMYLNGLFEATDTQTCYKLLADAFTIPGVILLCIGALIWVSTDGMFDGFTYAAKRLGSLIPFYGKNYKHERYYDYVMRKRGKRISGYGFIPIVGAVFTAIAAVFIVLYYVNR
mgnify:CR=1 FL=1